VTTKRHAPATERNREPIADVLARELPASGQVLEIASGTGEHAAFFAARFPAIYWQPSDPDADAIASIAAYRVEYAGDNLAAPVRLDAAASDSWPVRAADAIVCININSNSFSSTKAICYPKFDACVCINMVHISEWAATLGLFKGCAQVLTNEAPIILYGPYLEEGVETTASNLEFDRSLKARNPDWGLRRLDEVDRVASEHGFVRTSRYEMPANNLTLVYRRRSP
jgi:hypothetical protein